MEFTRPGLFGLVTPLVLALFFCVPSFAAGPNITNLSPSAGAVGASVIITGTNFGSTEGSNTITFNGVGGTPASWANTRIVVPVPTGATTGPVIVTVAGVGSAGVTFTVLPQPTIVSLSPSAAPVGTSITVNGSGFGVAQGVSTVKFGTKTGSPTSWTDTSIVVPVPSGASTGNVVIHSAGVDSNGASFTVLPIPTITNLSPGSGAIGASIAVTGTNFGAAQGSSTITFNGVPGSPTSWANTKIVVPVPGGASTGNLVVTVSGVPSAGASFAVAATPNVTGISPAAAPSGAVVTITGTGFGMTQGSGTVKFNSKLGTPMSWSDSSIVVSVPTGATTGIVIVNASGVASNGTGFTVLPTPNINNLSPVSGAIGALVTVTGTNFGATQGGSTVTFNGVNGTPTSWANGKVVVPVPVGATTGNIAAIVSGVASAGVDFAVAATPNVASLTPNAAPAGAVITIAGSGFGATQGPSTVKFNTKVGSPMSWNDAGIVVPVPAGATSGNVIVHASGVDTNQVSFTVLPAPTVSNISPVTGTQGTSVTISGTNFGSPQGSSTVTFNGVVANPASWSKTKIVVPVPLGATTGLV